MKELQKSIQSQTPPHKPMQNNSALNAAFQGVCK